MKYWEEMSSKFGFSDGESIPSDAEAHRSVYTQAINVLAEELGSAYRVVEYNRSGMHNWCLIVSIPKDADPTDITVPEGEDEGLRRAINVAHDLMLDQYVRTEVTVDRAGLDNLLTNLDITEEEREA